MIGTIHLMVRFGNRDSHWADILNLTYYFSVINGARNASSVLTLR